MLNISDVWTVQDLKQYNKERGYHFFDHDSMHFFRSRVHAEIYHASTGIVFITSEQCPEFDPKPLYTVRVMDASGRISDIGDFQGHINLKSARASVRQYLKDDAVSYAATSAV